MHQSLFNGFTKLGYLPILKNLYSHIQSYFAICYLFYFLFLARRLSYLSKCESSYAAFRNNRVISHKRLSVYCLLLKIAALGLMKSVEKYGTGISPQTEIYLVRLTLK
jgi:hypothetical protein